MAQLLPDWQPGAYVTNGKALYEVLERGTDALILLNCLTEYTLRQPISLIRPSSSFIPRSSWRLVQCAPVAPDMLTE